ncbi:MAG: hypothetical protein AB7U75_14865 [Hyphomicrobiaceae bacterium]
MSAEEAIKPAAFLTPFAVAILYGIGFNGWLAIGLSPILFILIGLALMSWLD